MPKTQIAIIQQIEKKALSEKQYGQLLKAQLKRGALQADITPDSLDANVKRLERQYHSFSDPALKAVYATALGKTYMMLGTDSDEVAGKNGLPRQWSIQLPLPRERAMVLSQLW